jgi:hypothetical protein
MQLFNANRNYLAGKATRYFALRGDGGGLRIIGSEVLFTSFNNRGYNLILARVNYN